LISQVSERIDCDSTNTLRELTRNEQQNETRIIESCNNVGTFYSYVNSHISYRNSIGVLVNDDCKILCDDNNKERLFNEYFASTAVSDNGSMLNHAIYAIPATNFSIDGVTFSGTNVTAAINKLKSWLFNPPALTTFSRCFSRN
jgi:hypothetical protein